MKQTALSLALLSALAVPAIAAEPDTEAVEFYHGGINHYFITATASEAKLIDDGAAGAGWVRTGRSFRAWLDAAKAPANAAGVCRFYSRGANSHFYTASQAECEGLKAFETQERARVGAAFTGWQYEGIAFRIETAGPAGCEAGTLPVTRVYNDGFVSGEGSNHRFVDDSDLRALMLDRSWVGEGTAFCARGKATGTNANLPPTTSAFDSLAATWSGTAKWKKEIAGVETRVSGPITLVIAADGTVQGSGRGCAFTGRVNAGDGFRSLFSGSLSAAGCEDAAFNGDYRRFQLERYEGGTLRVRAKRGDGADEAAIEVTLTAAGGTTTPPPAPTPSIGGITGEWSGTVGWTLLSRQGGNETVLVASNLPLALVIADSGALSGTGFGCTFSGQLAATSVPGVFGGPVTAAGCTEAGFGGAYAEVKVKRDDARLEIEFERQVETAGVTTKAKVEGTLARASSAPVPPVPPTPPVPPGPGAGLEGSYGGALVATIEVRDRTGGGDRTTTQTFNAAGQLSVAAGGGVTGTGFASCAYSGTLTLTNAALGLWTGALTATGCPDDRLNGTFGAKAHREGGLLTFEIERETEVGAIRTKIRVRGTLPRTGA